MLNDKIKKQLEKAVKKWSELTLINMLNPQPKS
jgi:hypothetical protein